MAHLEGTAQSAGFIVVSQSPDVCKSPDKPIPYNIVGFLDKSILVSTDVKFQGYRVFDTMSRVATVVGDEAGGGGGVASQTNLGMCKPVAGPSTTVYCNGNQICRHETAIYEMNLLGPNGTSNTIGKVYYLGAMMSGSVGPKGAMPNGANCVVPAASASELGALDKIKNSLSINSIEDAVSMSQKAYDVAQVDWSDPSSALGALGGMAGRAGLGDLAAGINAVNTAANTDWDDPASVLAAAGALAGPAMKAGQAASDYLGGDEASGPPATGEAAPPIMQESPEHDIAHEDIGLLPISESPLSTDQIADEVESSLLPSYLAPPSPEQAETGESNFATDDGPARKQGLIPNCPETAPAPSKTDDGWCVDQKGRDAGQHGGKHQTRSYGDGTTGSQQCVYDESTEKGMPLDRNSSTMGSVDNYGFATGENPDGTCKEDLFDKVSPTRHGSEYIDYISDKKEYNRRHEIMRENGVPSGSPGHGPYRDGISDEQLKKEINKAKKQVRRENPPAPRTPPWNNKPTVYHPTRNPRPAQL